MEDPAAQGENNSRSASEKGVSDKAQKKRGSGSAASSKSNEHQEDSTTPTANPPQGSQHFAMAPPPKPNFKATPTSAQPSNSTSQASSQEASKELPAASSQTIAKGDHQAAAASKQSANDKSHATPRKRSHVEVDQEPTAQDQESSDEDAEPGDQIATFDWMELESRYHRQMEHYAAEEQDLYRSFNELCGVMHALLAAIAISAKPTQYFYVWAETGHTHEVERSFKRMKTQITLVQHNEEVLESKRQHYVKVVEAFKSALQLLGGD